MNPISETVALFRKDGVGWGGVGGVLCRCISFLCNFQLRTF